MGTEMRDFKAWLGQAAAKSARRGESLAEWKRFLEGMKEEIEVWLDAT